MVARTPVSKPLQASVCVCLCARACVCHHPCLTTSRCSADDSLPRFVNFIQRQMFVLRTHRSPTERWVNLFLMWLTATTSATLGFNMLVSCSASTVPSAAAAVGAPPPHLYNISRVWPRPPSSSFCPTSATPYFPYLPRLPRRAPPRWLLLVAAARKLQSLPAACCCSTPACTRSTTHPWATYAASPRPPPNPCAHRRPCPSSSPFSACVPPCP